MRVEHKNYTESDTAHSTELMSRAEAAEGTLGLGKSHERHRMPKENVAQKLESTLTRECRDVGSRDGPT